MNTSDRNLGEALNTLPPLDPPPALWRAIETEMDQRRTRRDHRRWTLISTSIAAVVVLAVVVGLIGQPAVQAPTPTESDPALIQARLVSAMLEAQLRQQHFGAVSTGAVEALVWLENELGWLDARLASDPNNLELWQRRTELLSEMNRLYGQNHWQSEMRLTSL
jgi:hypothetical protein